MERYELVAALLLVAIGLVEVHSQDFPYISFKGNILPNNSIVILRDVGNATDGSDSIQCQTNLTTWMKALIVEVGIFLVVFQWE